MSNEALIQACDKGDLYEVKAMIYKKADLNGSVTIEGHSWKPLERAVYKGHTEIVETLLEAKADANAKDAFGRTALHVGCQTEHVSAIRALLRAGVDVNTRTERGETPMTFALRTKSIEAIRVLVESGVGPARE